MTGTYTEPQKAVRAFDHAAPVTPNDGANLPAPGFAEAIHISTAGALVVDMAGGETSITFAGVPVGRLDIRVTRVRATGTTASGIVQLW